MNTQNPVTDTVDAPDSLQAWRDAGTALGILYGQRTVQRLKEQQQDDALDEAIKEASHAQIVAAGLCICPSEAEIAELKAKFSSPDGALRDQGTVLTVGPLLSRLRAARVEQDAAAVLAEATGQPETMPDWPVAYPLMPGDIHTTA